MTYEMPDRRNSTNVTNFEFVCKIIEPSSVLHSKWIDRIWVQWKSENGIQNATPDCYTSQGAWQQAFKMLDRRRNAEGTL
jgi:hypothetical protein